MLALCGEEGKKTFTVLTSSFSSAMKQLRGGGEGSEILEKFFTSLTKLLAVA